jgi:hypothetical protein
MENTLAMVIYTVGHSTRRELEFGLEESERFVADYQTNNWDLTNNLQLDWKELECFQGGEAL